tara:strand:+ start:3370 stop:3597 length:228 start_codon:yes stop_codon:yes gene_type:complete
MEQPSLPQQEDSVVEAFDALLTVMLDPAASEWVKDSVLYAMQRDPVDAANDAELLASLLGRWSSARLESDRGKVI